MGGRGQQTDTARNRGRAIETDSHAASQRGSQRLRKARVRQTCISTVTGTGTRKLKKANSERQQCRQETEGGKKRKQRDKKEEKVKA